MSDCKSSSLESFLLKEEIHDLGVIDRFLALLWWHSKHGKKIVEFQEMSEQLKNAGFGSINVAREKGRLRKDKRVVSSDKGISFGLNVRALKQLDEKHLNCLENKPLPKSETLFQDNLFKNTRGYIHNIIKQINLSYDYQLYDCCAVMIRRLLETLIIEVYEGLNRAEEIKNSDQQFLMFSGLLSFLKNDKKINLGRQTLEGLDGFKKIADSSAHNRRFNASKKDIDDKLDGVKLAVTELRQLAFNV